MVSGIVYVHKLYQQLFCLDGYGLCFIQPYPLAR